MLLCRVPPGCIIKYQKNFFFSTKLLLKSKERESIFRMRNLTKKFFFKFHILNFINSVKENVEFFNIYFHKNLVGFSRLHKISNIKIYSNNLEPIILDLRYHSFLILKCRWYIKKN